MKAGVKNIMKKADSDRAGRSQSTDKVEAILQGAMQEFLAHGYAATTMDKVTAAAGVSKTTVYSYFQDKESLFAALVERLVDDHCQAALNPEDAQSWEGETSEVLQRFGVNFLENVKSKEQLRDLVRLIIAESGRFPVLAQIFVRKVDKKVFQLLVKYFVSNQELQLPDPEAAARVFLGSLVHFVIVQDMLHAKDIMPMESDRLINILVYLLTANLREKSDDRYSGTRQKSSRRKRSPSGKFEPDYQSEPKRLRSIRLTDTAWEKLAEIAKENELTRSELIENLARQEEI